MKLDNIPFKLSEGEKIFLSYECSKLKKIFSANSIRYLTVTNKRIAYHTHDKSLKNNKIQISEMPLDDVAHINAGVGSTINWLLLFTLIIIFMGVFSFLYDKSPRFITHWITAAILVVPYSIAWLLKKNILNKDLEKQFQKNIEKSFAGEFVQNKSGNYFLRIFEALFAIGVLLLAWHIASHRSLLMSPLPYVLKGGASLWVLLKYIGQQRSFYLSIGSKSAEGSGINWFTPVFSDGV